MRIHLVNSYLHILRRITDYCFCSPSLAWFWTVIGLVRKLSVRLDETIHRSHHWITVPNLFDPMLEHSMLRSNQLVIPQLVRAIYAYPPYQVVNVWVWICCCIILNYCFISWRATILVRLERTGMVQSNMPCAFSFSLKIEVFNRVVHGGYLHK